MKTQSRALCASWFMLGTIGCGSEPSRPSCHTAQGGSGGGTVIASSDTAIATAAAVTGQATTTFASTSTDAGSDGPTLSSSGGALGTASSGDSSSTGVGGVAGSAMAGTTPSEGGALGAGGAEPSSGGSGGLTTPGGRLMFTEYFEGLVGGEKALEISNVGETSRNLEGCQVELYYNDNLKLGRGMPLAGELEAQASLVLCHDKASGDLLAQCDMLHSGLLFNGNDSLLLRCGEVVEDSFGQLGSLSKDEEAWQGPLGVTSQDAVLRRRCGSAARLEPLSVFDVAASWHLVPQPTNDSFDLSGLGDSACQPPADP